MLAAYGYGSSGGGLSYGPLFWVIVAIVALALIALVVWRLRRHREGRSATRSSSMDASNRQDRAA